MSGDRREVPGREVTGREPGTTASEVFDPGLQVERTALSWQRTGLAVVAGSLVGARVLAPGTGWWGIGLGVAGALLGLLVLVRSGIRHRLVHSALTSSRREGPTVLPGAMLMAALAAAVVVAGLVALVFVVRAAG